MDTFTQFRDFVRTCNGRKARDPGFATVVVFDYNDGPESGLAVYPSGEGVSFYSLGDSSSRLGRAYELRSIGGGWLTRLQELGIVPSLRRFVLPSQLPELLEPAMAEATATGLYVGVGSAFFSRITVVEVTPHELDTLRRLNGAPKAYPATKRLTRPGRKLVRHGGAE